jgi:superfamily I DNA and/or RNA helicase
MALLHTDFDTVIVDEAARANPLELLIVLVRGRRIILVGDQNQLPHVLEPRLEKAVEAGRSGDVARILGESLFARVWQLYEGALPKRIVTLSDDFRMHPDISSYISDTFYGGGVTALRKAEDLPLVTRITEGKALAFFHVGGLPEKPDSCWCRPCEVSALADRVDQVLKDEPAERSIGVVSFYAEQVELLGEESRLRGWPGRVLVGTVDAFQGREFDIVFISCVRSGGGVGFLALPNRLNVAMSRARRLVAVFGDGNTVRRVPQIRAFIRACRDRGYLHDSA